MVTPGMTLRATAPAATRDRRLARRGAPAAAIVADAVFRVIGEVGMAGAVLVADVAIVLGALVDILDHQHDRRAGGALAAGPLILEDAGQDLHRVRFLALGGEARLAGPALVEEDLESLPPSAANPGGQPSTTQPMAGPWLSPKVVTRKRWPKVLCDMRPD
jgi:hypothetical protein